MFNNRRNSGIAILGVAAVAAFLVSASLRDGTTAATPQRTVPLTEFVANATGGSFAAVTIDDATRTVRAELADGSELVAVYPAGSGADLATRLADDGVAVTATGPGDLSQPVWVTIVANLLPALLGIGAIIYLMRRFSGASLVKSGSRKSEVDEMPLVRFTDIAGAREAVEDLAEVVDYLRNPDQFGNLGARTPKGVLLVGPPGTGKTMLAKATAGEAGVAFFSLSGSDFVEMYAGLGARRVRDLFDKARKTGKAIIFIDEVDAVGKARAKNGGNPASEERENTLNALLVELDGFSSTPGVVIIAATNRPEMLDEALLRPGRFDRHVTVGAPDRAGRADLYRLFLSKVQLDSSLDADDIADTLSRRSPGLTGAQVESVINEAALGAARNGSATVVFDDLSNALERVTLGRERRSAKVAERARRITAWHEAGHALVAVLVPDAPALERVSIVPRGGAGGVTWFGGNDDESFLLRSEAVAMQAVSFGGRAAEEILLDGNFSQGAQGDIAAATARAQKMVCEWGMSQLGLSHIDIDRLVGDEATIVRREVEQILNEGLTTARRLLSKHRAALDAIAEALLDHETIDGDTVKAIVAEHVETASSC
jgi:cell division protease FtsH